MNNISSAVLTVEEATRLGAAIQQRALQLGLNQTALATKSGLSRGHVVRIMNGEMLKPLRTTLAKLETGLSWPIGHAEQVAKGTDDVTVTTALPDDVADEIVQKDLDAEWLVVVRDAAEYDTMTQRAALDAARRIFDARRSNRRGQ